MILLLCSTKWQRIIFLKQNEGKMSSILIRTGQYWDPPWLLCIETPTATMYWNTHDYYVLRPQWQLYIETPHGYYVLRPPQLLCLETTTTAMYWVMYYMGYYLMRPEKGQDMTVLFWLPHLPESDAHLYRPKLEVLRCIWGLWVRRNEQTCI